MAESGEESMTKQADIDNLMEHISRNTYSAKGDVTSMLALNTCLDLFGKDYTYTIINNYGGQLCGHYPSKIVVLDYERPTTSNVDNRYQPLNDRRRLEELMRQARVARCRTRFVAPVILYKGKHICRSATLAGWQELFGRKGMDMVLSGGIPNGRSPYEEIQSAGQTTTSGSHQVFDRHRGQDILLLEELNVKYICDLMVEMKKVKYGVSITSSEKVDKENRYKNFSVISLPYPGCEFFSRWKESQYDSENVHYDWSQELNTALLDLQNDPVLTSLPVDWHTYKDWDLVRLTQNYLQALIRLIDQGTSGVLIHCISGWDRTPLFVSLLRLSLWADGVIHKSLPPSDILYLTLAYDWYLFAHSLPDRLSKGQEIMYFCFKMLLYIGGQEFSVNPQSEGPSHHQTQPGSAAQPSDCVQGRYPFPSSMPGIGGLRHQGSNVSLTSNTSFGSDGVPFIMDTTQDEDSISPLGWEVSPSPQRSRQASGNSADERRSRRTSLGRGPGHIDSTTYRDSPPHRRRHISDSSTQSEGRARSPDVRSTLETQSHHGCSTAATDQLLSASLVSNHFSSSPVNMPLRQRPQDQASSLSHTPSLGSWVDVGMPQMTPPHMITPPKHPPDFDTQASINSCHEASDLNNTSARRRRLDAVAQMFEDAYIKAVLSKPINSSGTLSSLIGNVAEKMGFRSGPR